MADLKNINGKKFIDSKFNLMNIRPYQSLVNSHTYYLGVFMKNYNIKLDDVELIEVEQAPSGSRIEDYFPLIIEVLNKRGNWKFLTTQQAYDTNVLDFAFTNATSILSKAFGNYRFLLNTENHYISNKAFFYDKFKAYDFIVEYEAINKDDILLKQSLLDHKFTNKQVILKPDKGSVSTGIMALDPYDYETIKYNIVNGKYFGWTLSQVFIPKLYDGYIVSNRIYFLVVKIDDAIVKSYFYKDFMNYRAMERFTGDILSKEEFLTNYMDPNDPEADEKFVKTRFIPHHKWLAMFPEHTQCKIYNNLSHILNIITATMKDDLISYNDNIFANKRIHVEKQRVGFHIYGVDALINEDGCIKIIEINGAPAFNVKTRYYGIPDRLDYFDLMEEIVQKSLDIVFPPLVQQAPLNNFIEVYCGTKINNPVKSLYYIPKSIISQYDFIYDALDKRKFLKRTKNMFDNIDVFYGLRERYIVPQSNMNYYDEIINYKMSPRMKNAKIINKIQGITYYLASKDGLYKKMITKYGDKVVHQFHPESILVYYYPSYEKMFNKIKSAISKLPGVRKWIVKPVHGSRGLGIRIFENNPTMLNEITNYIITSSQIGFILTKKTNQYTFDGKELIIEEIKKYKYWMICKYIDNPHIFTPFLANKLSLKSRPHYSNFIQNKPSIIGKKYNIRFYVLIVLGKLPTFADLDNYNEEQAYDIVNVYLYSDCMVYFSMLPYHSKLVPPIYNGLDTKILQDMKHLTNLEMVNIVQQALENSPNPEPFDAVQTKKDVTCMLSDLYPKDSVEYIGIKNQIELITKKTINSIKYDLRPLNRHEGYKSCFNLLAYDTLLDNNGKLWVMEINRGPDMVGLQYNIGKQGCLEMFDEIFKISIDPYYQNHCECPNIQCDSKNINKEEQKKCEKRLDHSQTINPINPNSLVNFKKLKVKYNIVKAN
jgi:glutathione synthase/RimK-type ligase-like ATP-grasp enzyme